MRFYYIELFPIYLIFILIVLFFFIIKERARLNFIANIWFVKKSMFLRISTLLYYFSITLLIISLLDLRIVDEKNNVIKNSKKSELEIQKVAILLDISPSMLVKDVNGRSRLQESIYIINNYLRTKNYLLNNKNENNFVFEYALFVFTDYSVRLAPFTRDLNIIDVKLKALESLIIESANSDILLSLNEVANYFRSQYNADEFQDIVTGGEILIFSDGEQTSNFDLNNKSIGDQINKQAINVLFVAVGTQNGGRIPIQDKKGNVLYYKNNPLLGKDVVSKIDKNFIINLKKIIKRYKYILLEENSTADILNNIFNIEKEFEIINYQEKIDSRPKKSFSSYILISAFIIWLISGLIARICKFEIKTQIGIIIVMATVIINAEIVMAKERVNEIFSWSKELKDKSTDNLLRDFKEAKASFEENYLLAMKLREEEGQEKESLIVFNELLEDNFQMIITEGKYDFLLNYGTVLLMFNQKEKGIMIYNYIKSLKNKIPAKIFDRYMIIMRGNTLLAISRKASKSLSESIDDDSGKNDEEDLKNKSDDRMKDNKNREYNENNKDNQNIFLTKMLNDDRKTQEEIIKNIMSVKTLKNLKSDW
ncbi:MAG: VWA domain-containing protein [Oligoflexia bacterium]|nr:VWA domain-containing protein [Oligoflexia bacterium]